MSDSLAQFSLSNPGRIELLHSLARVVGDFSQWHGVVGSIGLYVEASRSVGALEGLHNSVATAAVRMEEMGFVRDKPPDFESQLRKAAEHHLSMGEHGAALARVVLLHMALEKHIWRLVRFGIVHNRDTAIELIASKNVKVADVAAKGAEGSLDGVLEKWWREMANASILVKWDALVSLFGFPTLLVDPPFRFDRDLIEQFDLARNNAVHGNGELLRTFDLTDFQVQAFRGRQVWLIHICKQMSLTIPANALLTAVE
jgi:hypothetical protein